MAIILRTTTAPDAEMLRRIVSAERGGSLDTPNLP
jgi:hypothetical protein